MIKKIFVLFCLCPFLFSCSSSHEQDYRVISTLTVPNNEYLVEYVFRYNGFTRYHIDSIGKYKIDDDIRGEGRCKSKDIENDKRYQE